MDRVNKILVLVSKNSGFIRLYAQKRPCKKNLARSIFLLWFCNWVLLKIRLLTFHRIASYSFVYLLIVICNSLASVKVSCLHFRQYKRNFSRSAFQNNCSCFITADRTRIYCVLPKTLPLKLFCLLFFHNYTTHNYRHEKNNN